MSFSEMDRLDQLACVFDSLIENLQLVISQIKDGEIERIHEDFNSHAFWIRIGESVKAVSAEATKICLAFSQPPVPSSQEIQPLIERVEGATLCLVSAYYALPKTQGLTLQKQTQDSVIGIVKAVQTLARVIKTEGCRGSKQQLQCTGSVWELCDGFSSLPTDNRCAVIGVMEESLGLVKDALEELEEAQQSGNEDMSDLLQEDDADATETWSEEDRQLLGPSVGLIKVSKACLKKTITAVKANGKCDCEENVAQLDGLVDRTRVFSPAVDDLAESLYSPVQHTVVRLKAHRLAVVIEHCLEYLKNTHLTTEADAQWLDFLSKAGHHNLEKVKDLVPADQELLYNNE